MRRSRFRIKPLGLLVSAVCMMALGMAGVAQAEETGGTWHWKNPANGNTGTFSATLEAAPVIAIENNSASLLFTTKGGTKVTILCTAVAFDEGGQLANNGEILLGRLKFTGCVTLLNGTLSKNCTPKTTGTEAGTILTLKGKGLMLLHKLPSEVKDTTILLEPDNTETKELVAIEMSELCSIGEKVPVTGDLVIWDCQNTLSTLKTTHLFEEFPALHNLIALGQPATLDGSINVTLGGVHSNFEYGGTAN